MNMNMKSHLLSPHACKPLNLSNELTLNYTSHCSFKLNKFERKRMKLNEKKLVKRPL